MRIGLAKAMRRWADRLDDRGAPKAIGWAFTFERNQGIVFNDQARGCPLWYYGDADYDRAHDEAAKPAQRVNWATMTLHPKSRA